MGVLLINSAQNLMNSTKSQMFGVADDIRNDYILMSGRLNDQIFEYKQTLNQFQADVHSREQRLRTELESKQRVLLHMNGIAEQQKHDQMIMQNEYEEKLRILKEQIEKTKVENEMKSNDLSQSDGQKLQVQIKQYLDYVKQIGHELQSELLRYAQHSGNSQQYQHLQTQKMQINSSIDRIYALASNAISIGSSASNNANNVNGSNE